MIPVLAKWQSTLAADLGAFQRAADVGLRWMAREWARRFLPIHFTEYGQSKYDYAERNPDYLRRKQRKRGHRKPLVWSGTMARDLMTGVRILPGRLRATAVMTSFARALNLSGSIVRTSARGRGQEAGLYARYPDTKREIATVTEAEEAELAQTVDRVISRWARSRARTS